MFCFASRLSGKAQISTFMTEKIKIFIELENILIIKIALYFLAELKEEPLRSRRYTNLPERIFKLFKTGFNLVGEIRNPEYVILDDF